MARQLELPEAEVERIRVAALLHDVGKVAVPRRILDKPAALTSAEWRSVVQHPRIGQVILEQRPRSSDAVPIILHHHERFGGHGYPYGLRANEIPLGRADRGDRRRLRRDDQRPAVQARDVARAPRSPSSGCHAGTQFDPELVVLFCDLYADHAPTPDPAILALMHPPTPTPGPGRRERKSRPATASSETMAAEGHGLVDLGGGGSAQALGGGSAQALGGGPGTTTDRRGIAAS